mgnify:FL=1
MSEIKKVQVRGGFSDRRGIKPLNTKMQLDELDKRTRIGIANLLREWYDDGKFAQYRSDFCERLLKDIYFDFVDDQARCIIKYQNDDFIESYIYLPISANSYDDVLTIVEYVTNYFIEWQSWKYPNHWYNNDFIDYKAEINELFEREYVGYRFIESEITPISDDIEVDEIEKSLDIEFQGCKSHIKKALSFLSDRENPDYKNSIKESISAVESICQIITQNSKATLGEALKKLEDHGVKIHEAMRKSFSSLYGYTSDEGGIRHCEGMFRSDVSFEEAKYMLVSCCAFVNYLIAEYGKINKD